MAKRILAADPNTLTTEQQDILFGPLGHFGIGIWIRNNWGLWSGGPLADYFIGKGIYHPDDMSGVILSSYAAKLRGESFDIAKTAQELERYWLQMAEPNDYVVPNTGQVISDVGTIYFRSNRAIHEGKNTTTNEIWLYELDRGWYEPNEDELRLIRNPPEDN